MKALLIDAGNTRLKWGVADNGAIHETGHVLQSDVARTGVASLTTRLPHDVDTVMISNVAGQTLGTRLSGVLSAHCDCDVHFARTRAAGYGITNAYDDPRQMGVDRWVAMIGAHAEFNQDVLVVDAGTAVTLDAVDTDGQHLGGQIVPGFRLMTGSLGRETSDIPIIDTVNWNTPVGLDSFGASTAEGVTKGAASAIAGAVMRAISVLRSNGYDPAVVLTGGDASAILAALEDESVKHRPDLVLAGLWTMLESEE